MKEDLIRISVGLEDVEDIIWDLDQALTYATGTNREGEKVGESAADQRAAAERAAQLAAEQAAFDADAACYLRSCQKGGQIMAETTERTWEGPSAPERLNILRDTRSIAIVGMSDKISRASYFVATYLLSSSRYTVYFVVNPILAAKGKEVLRQKVYVSLEDLPEVPDMVEIFRRNEDLPGVVQEAIDLGAKTVWMQLGSWNEDAAHLGENAGLNVVMDRCVKIEHARFHGGLHLAGFNTGVISSKRQVTA